MARATRLAVGFALAGIAGCVMGVLGGYHTFPSTFLLQPPVNSSQCKLRAWAIRVQHAVGGP